jgi:hypothetical protein
MAAQPIVQGVLREVWRDAGQAGGPPQLVTTGIKASLTTLSRVRGLLTIDSMSGGTPAAVSAVVSLNAVGHIIVTVGNTTVGSTIAWTLDIELVHSSQQANDFDGSSIIQIASGGLVETLAQTYAIGATAADQRMIVTNAHGGGVTIDASDTGGVTGDGVCLELRQNALHAMPFVVGRRIGGQFPGPVMNFDRARGTYPVPVDVVQNDELGTIDWYGRLGGAPVLSAREVVICTAVAGGMYSAIDFYAARAGTAAAAWRISLNGAADGLFTGYGNCGIMPSADNAGFIGSWASAAWQVVVSHSFFARANVCIGIDTTGANAHHTACFAVANTVLPAASVGLVHVYAGELGNTTPDAPAQAPVEAGSALSWSQAGGVSVATILAPDRMIPVMVNGTAYWLLAVADLSP